MILKQKFKIFLVHKGKTIAEAAGEMGIPVQTVYGWLSGKRFPRREHLHKFVEYTQGAITANDFFTKSKNIQEAKISISSHEVKSEITNHSSI